MLHNFNNFFSQPPPDFANSENLTPLLTINRQEGSQFQQILHLMQDIKRDNSELKKELKGLKEEFQLFRVESDVTHKRLLTEILFLKKNSTNNVEKIIPKSPFIEQLDLWNFENSLNSSPEMAVQLEEEIYKIAINNGNKFIRSIYKIFFSDELAKTYSWKGTSNKPSIRTLTLTSAIKSAYNRRFSEGEKVFEAVAIKWFQTAGDRLKIKNKKLPNKNLPNNDLPNNDLPNNEIPNNEPPNNELNEQMN